nr:hypothetical protein [Tanacetum cinerariifolium]
MRRIGKGFLGVQTPLFDNMLVQQQVHDDAEVEEDEDDNEVYAASTPPSPTSATTPPSPQQEPIPSPPQAQHAASSESLMNLLNTLMETYVSLTQALEITKLKQRVRKLEKKRKFKSFGLKRLKKGGITKLDADEDVTLVDVDADTQGRIEEDVTAVKDINVVESEPTVFDDEEVTMSMAQTLIKIKAEKARILDEQMAKRLQDKEIEQAAARERQEKKDLERAKVLQQQYDRKQEDIDWNISDKDEEPSKKRVAKEKLLQESFKQLSVEVEVSEGSKTYWRMIRVGGITQAFQSFKYMLKDFDRDDLNALWRIAKEKFNTAMPTHVKEKALWAELTRLYKPNANDVFCKLQRYMHNLIMWKLHLNYGVHQVSSTTRRYEIYILAEKDYPLSNQVITLMLSSRLQVEKDREAARDLVMKIFLKANQPKSKSLDTSSN